MNKLSGKNMSFLSDSIGLDKRNQLQLEYVNEKFKELLKISGDISPNLNSDDGSEFLMRIMQLEIFEEQS
jgi:hypothetical protein